MQLWAVCLASGARAESEDDARARAHFVAAEAYFQDQRYADAVREFDEAYKLSGRPEMLVNRSRAHERAGSVPDAIADLELLLERHPQTSYRAEAEARLQELRALLPPEQASVEPAADPAPAEPVVLTPPPLEPPTETSKSIWPPRLPTLLVGSVAVASALAAVGTGWAAHAKKGDLDGRCPGGQCDGPFEADRDRGQRLARTSTGLTFAALALGGVTVGLWVWDMRAEKNRSQLALRSSRDGAEARLRVEF